MLLLFVNIGHINHTYFPQKSFIYKILCLFICCPYSINITESVWTFVILLKKSVCVKILLHANVRAGKAALVRNYFPRRNHFCFKGSNLLSLSQSAISDQINADVLFRGVNYLYLATFTCPTVFLPPISTWMAVNGVSKCSLRST